jgi:hypothetical protein
MDQRLTTVSILRKDRDKLSTQSKGHLTPRRHHQHHCILLRDRDSDALGERRTAIGQLAEGIAHCIDRVAHGKGGTDVGGRQNADRRQCNEFQLLGREGKCSACSRL